MENDYVITIEDKGQYILARVEGRGTDIDLFVRSVLPAIEMCKNTSHKKLLLEDAISDDWNPRMMEELASKLFSKGFDKLKIVVFVANPNRHLYTKYAEIFARSIGMDVQVYIDHDKAMHQIVNA